MPRNNFLFAGNAGAGKSYLLNRIFRRRVFTSAICAKGVTTGVSTLEKDGIVYVDLPGLLEADEDRVKRNTARVCEAMELPGVHKVAFVFGMGNGGRLSSSDVLAYQRFCAGIRSLFPLRLRGMFFVMRRSFIF